jgi:hypothetical protein
VPTVLSAWLVVPQVRLTLGALAVFDAAQRGQDRGRAWGDALDYASSVPVRLLDVLPDRELCAAGGRAEQEEESR